MDVGAVATGAHAEVAVALEQAPRRRAVALAAEAILLAELGWRHRAAGNEGSTEDAAYPLRRPGLAGGAPGSGRSRSAAGVRRRALRAQVASGSES